MPDLLQASAPFRSPESACGSCEIVPLDLDDATFIALNLRADDATEIYSIRDDDNPAALARDVMACLAARGLGFCARLDGRPVAAFGVLEKWPAVYEAFAFATDSFPKVGGRVTRFILREIAPWLRARGARRLQCHSHEDHWRAHRWLRFLGAQEEARLECFGRDGSAYLIFAWTGEEADSDPEPVAARHAPSTR